MFFLFLLCDDLLQMFGGPRQENHLWTTSMFLTDNLGFLN